LIPEEVSRFNGLKIIYPLINIPESWIESWAQKYDLSCTTSPADGISEDLMIFLEEFIPQVRENMLKSALYVSENFEKG
jgi:tRNA(Ile)-lysidine synthase TilS/MesJ